MANENHERYNDVDICTYTDDITTQNSFTAEQIMSYTLSAGVIPWFTNTASVTTGRYSHESATGGPNSNVPFFKESNSQILWYDDSALATLPADNMYRYKHCVYLAIANNSNKIATSLKIDSYKNFLTIDTRTYSDIQGNPVHFYSPVINTKYGSGNEWIDSVLTPSFLFKNLNDIVGGQSVGSTISVSRWWWGGEDDTGNDLWGHNTYDRNLQYGTDMGGHEMIPWELPGTDPIRISEGSQDATFPCRFDNEHLTWAFYGNNPLQLLIGVNNIEDCLLLCAFCGLKFEYNGITYKPLANGGVIYGYTDDMNVTSEWDNWHDIGDHVIPVTPPAPYVPPESFKSDKSAYNDAYTTGVPSSQLYAMTLAQVNDMFSKLTNGGIIPANFEPGNAVISIQRYPFSLSSFASAVESDITWTARPDVIGPETPTRIMFPPVGEEIKGYPIYNPVKRVSLGSFKLSEFWINYIAFLNREISASLYIPFCGIIEIDINAILNKTITVYLTIDVISGGCTAAVDINGCMYTTVSGSCSADMYFSTSNYGTIRAALRSNTADQFYNAAQIGMAIVSGISSGGGSLVAGLKSGGFSPQTLMGAGFNMMGKAVKRSMIRNGLTPSVHGSAGDMSSWKLPMHCQLILSLPRPNHSSDSIYGHSHGYLTVSEKTIGSCSGLTVCDNPDVSNIDTATDTEKEMIYNMLQNGVYV